MGIAKVVPLANPLQPHDTEEELWMDGWTQMDKRLLLILILVLI